MMEECDRILLCGFCIAGSYEALVLLCATEIRTRAAEPISLGKCVLG